jgi:hypothetical protein
MIDPALPVRSEPVLSGSTLRQFAALWLVLFAGLACWQAFLQHGILALICAGLAVAIGPLGLVKPRTIQPIFVTAKTVTHPVGWIITNLILIALFYLVFTPVGLFLKLVGRDILDREPSSRENTYWARKPGPVDVRDYFRQS